MDINDMPYLLLGGLAAVRDDSIRTADQMIKKGKELAGTTKSKVTSAAQDKKLEATFQDLVKKGKKESEEMVDAIGKVFRDTLNSLGVVTKSDIRGVEKRLAEVEKKLGSPAPAKKPAAKKKAAKKPAAKKKAAKKA